MRRFRTCTKCVLSGATMSMRLDHFTCACVKLASHFWTRLFRKASSTQTLQACFTIILLLGGIALLKYFSCLLARFRHLLSGSHHGQLSMPI